MKAKSRVVTFRMDQATWDFMRELSFAAAEPQQLVFQLSGLAAESFSDVIPELQERIYGH